MRARSLLLMAFVALALTSSTEARRLWQFPSLSGAPAAPTTGDAATTPAPAAGAGAGATPPAAGAGAAATAPAAGTTTTPPAAASTTPAPAAAATTTPAPAAGTTAPAATGGAAATTTAAPAATGAAAATTTPPTTTPPTTTPAAAAPTADATAPAGAAEPVAATATATGTPGEPAAAVATASTTEGVAADATGDATATAAAGDEAVTAAGEEAAEPAPPTETVLRPGVYVIADPPPPPKPKAKPVAPAPVAAPVAAAPAAAAPAAPATSAVGVKPAAPSVAPAVGGVNGTAAAGAAAGAAVPAAAAGAVGVNGTAVAVPAAAPAAGAVAVPAAAPLAAANATVGPPMPAPGKNLMVVMTVMGQQAKDIYKNQQPLRDQVAQAAGVGTAQVLFYNQTTNQDPRTGVTAMSLIMNVNCESQAQCAQAGAKLYNSSSQTRLTDSLARNSISMLPGTFQVYGVQTMGPYRGNETLTENKALTAIKPKTAQTDLDYNSALSRAFAGGMNVAEPMAGPGAKKPKKGSAADEDELPAAGLPGSAMPAMPGDIPLAGPGVFGNFSIPNLPQSSFAGMGNATLLPNTMGGGSMGMGTGGLPNELPGLSSGTGGQPLRPQRARSSAGSGFAAGGVLPTLLAAAAAAAVFVL